MNVHDAARFGPLETVETLLKDNPSLVFSEDKDGDTPLHCAAAHGQRGVAELLLASGADVNAKDTWSRTPLHNAAIYGYKGVAELLLANGADVNAKDSHNGATPLHLTAIFEGSTLTRDHRDVARLLLTNNADVNAKDNNGHTPLNWATKRRDKKEMAELLRQHGGLGATWFAFHKWFLAKQRLTTSVQSTIDWLVAFSYSMFRRDKKSSDWLTQFEKLHKGLAQHLEELVREVPGEPFFLGSIALALDDLGNAAKVGEASGHIENLRTILRDHLTASPNQRVARLVKKIQVQLDEIETVLAGFVLS